MDIYKKLLYALITCCICLSVNYTIAATTQNNYNPLNRKTKVLVTGSAGHLGEALMRVLPKHGYDVVGIDITTTPFTN